MSHTYDTTTKRHHRRTHVGRRSCSSCPVCRRVVHAVSVPNKPKCKFSSALTVAHIEHAYGWHGIWQMCMGVCIVCVCVVPTIECSRMVYAHVSAFTQSRGLQSNIVVVVESLMFIIKFECFCCFAMRVLIPVKLFSSKIDDRDSFKSSTTVPVQRMHRKYRVQ